MDDLLADLNPAQREAVTHLDGPLLIVAGPGSGKTRVITRRVVYLLQQRISAGSILAVTFTNKAAGEMRQRIWELIPQSEKVDPRGVVIPPHRFLRVSTFHSFGVYLLHRYGDRLGIDPHFTIYDQADRTRLIKDAIVAANIDNVRFTPEAIEATISRAKNHLLRPEAYAAHATDFFSQVVARVYPLYEKKLRDANALDFDDLLYWPAVGLKNNPELRAELDARYRYVLVDEYQDTNYAQYEFVRQLSRDLPNLCVVGDPDQSIYAWRGANIRNILDFERDFPGARVIKLERNYRSTKAILHAASHLIAHNQQRKPKELITKNPYGEKVKRLIFPTGLDEAEGVALRIREAVQERKRNYRDFAIFLRINALSRILEAVFLKHRMPFQIVRGLAFFERKENRDVLAYLRLLQNPRDDLSFQRVVNEPPRGVGKVSLGHLAAYAEPREMSLLAAAEQVERIPAIKGKAVAGLHQFAVLIRDLAKLSDAQPDEVIRQVLDRTGYRQMLQNSTDEEDQERLANIEELITAARQFAEEDSSRTIADFLENITLASDVDAWDDSQDRVSIMTLHSAKGLEFPVVYMLAVEQGLLPHERSSYKDEDVEEERRLAFVGMTRAKEELYMCHANLREFRGTVLYTIPSMFLSELPEEHVELVDLSEEGGVLSASDEWRGGSDAAEKAWPETGYTPRRRRAEPARTENRSAVSTASAYVEGMMVRHDQYGVGRVTQVSGYGSSRKVKIRFSSHGEKTFIADKAKLAVVRST